MAIEDIMPKLELREFLVLIIPGIPFSLTILYLIDNKLSNYTFLPNDFTHVGLPYVSLLIFYLLTSGLVFGLIFHFLYLWPFRRFYEKIYNLIAKIYNFITKKLTNDQQKDESEFIKFLNKSPAEFRDILLKTVNIDISYKQTYRLFFGGLSVSILFSIIIIPFLEGMIAVLISLIIMFLISLYFSEKLRREFNDTRDELINKLKKFLEHVEGEYPDVYQAMLKKKGR